MYDNADGTAYGKWSTMYAEDRETNSNVLSVAKRSNQMKENGYRTDTMSGLDKIGRFFSSS